MRPNKVEQRPHRLGGRERMGVDVGYPQPLSAPTTPALSSRAGLRLEGANAGTLDRVCLAVRHHDIAVSSHAMRASQYRPPRMSE